MKIVVIGGSGLIGSKVIARLAAQGHEAVAASRNSGVNTLTGEGLAQVLNGAAVVVDVSNSPSFDAAAVLEFFTTSTRNLLAQEAIAGVTHHVALSVVGVDRPPERAYFRAKITQEQLIKESSIPYSIIRATQFFEFIKSMADASIVGDEARVAPVLIQPIAAEDVANSVSRIAASPPINGIIEIAGPEPFRFDELIRQNLKTRNDPRKVITDPQARYFGAEVIERSLVPTGSAQLGAIRLEQWRP